jgi:alkaline phosphatase
MSWRTRLLAVFILLAFTSFALFYVRTYVKQRAHGIVLFIAGGVDLATLNQAREQAAVRGQPLRIDQLNTVALLRVRPCVPDAGAVATAMACGQRVKSGLVGINEQNQVLTSLIYQAQARGRMTGLVTTGSLTGPVPVAFYGYDRGEEENYRNAATLVDAAKIDVVLGGGGQYFVPAHVGNEKGRLDGRDLLQEAARQGYMTPKTVDELNQVSAWRTRLFGIFAPDHLYFSALRGGISVQPSLADMVRRAIECLQYNISGYFLVVDHQLAADAARNNFTQLVLNETAVLDEAVRTAMDYAGREALVIVTNGYSYGLLEQPEKNLAVDWLTGPGGPPAAPADVAWLRRCHAEGLYNAEPGSLVCPRPAVRFSRAAEITTGPAWLAARGFGSERFKGSYANTDVYGLLLDQF